MREDRLLTETLNWNSSYYAQTSWLLTLYRLKKHAINKIELCVYDFTHLLTLVYKTYKLVHFTTTSSLGIESGISYVWWTRGTGAHDNFPFFNGKTTL